MAEAPKFEVQLNITGDDWPSVMARLRTLSMDLPPLGAEHHRTGSDSQGVTYTVDVYSVEVVSEPPAKVRA